MLIVVTGAHGFLGRHIVSRLIQEGYRVLAVDRKAYIGVAIPGVQYHLSDLSDPSTLIPPDCEPVGKFVLIHLAWDLRNRESSFKVQSDQVTVLAGLLDAWTGRGLDYVIAPGSAQEFGGIGGRIAEDATSVAPYSPYGWAKRAAFEMASSWALRNGIGLLWLRPFIVYGPGQAGSMLIPYAVRQAASGEEAEFSDGEQLRDFVYVDDVVDAFLLGLKKRLPGVHDFNLGGEKPVKVRDILSEIASHFANIDKFKFGARPRRSEEPNEQIANSTRAARDLGWSPSVGWREGIRLTCDRLSQ